MGMSASQARLLTITARMHDVEFQAQSIQNAKIALATQQDQAYKDYLEALDQTTFTVKDNSGGTVVANFNTLCGIDAAKATKGQRYVLRDEHNRLIVDDKIMEGYKNYTSKYANVDAYGFALYMMDGQPADFSEEKYIKAEEDIFNEKNNKGLLGNMEGLRDAISKKLAQLFEYFPTGYDVASNFSDYIKESSDDTVEAIRSKLIEAKKNIIGNFDGFASGEITDYSLTETQKTKGQQIIEEIEELFEQLEYNMYTQNAEEIYDQANQTTGDFDYDDFWYYVNMYKQIEANGGAMVSISSFDGIDGIGDASNDSDWLQQMVKSGRITIDVSNLDKKGKLTFSATSVPSDDSLEYTTTSTMDKSKLAKVEAEYEYKLKQIDQKDKKYDMDLSKLETERTALKTEYESVKKVISDNIERTFGIFS